MKANRYTYVICYRKGGRHKNKFKVLKLSDQETRYYH